MPPLVSVVKRQGSTMGTVIASVTDDQNVVQEINFYVQVQGSPTVEGPLPPDILRRKGTTGVYEKDIVLDTSAATTVWTKLVLPDGSTVSGDAQTFTTRNLDVGPVYLPLAGGTLTGGLRLDDAGYYPIIQFSARGSGNTSTLIGSMFGYLGPGIWWDLYTAGSFYRWRRSADGMTTNLMDLTGKGTLSVNDVLSAENGVQANAARSSSSGGVSLYGGMNEGHGIYLRGQTQGSAWGGFGYVNADWAMYFTTDASAGRGWVYRNMGSGANVASISNAGEAAFQGRVLLGANTAPWKLRLGGTPFDDGYASASGTDGNLYLDSAYGNGTYVNWSRGATFSVGDGAAGERLRVDANGLHVVQGTSYLGDVMLQDQTLYLRGAGDFMHGVRFAPAWGVENLQGVVLFSNFGGALGTRAGGDRIALRWDAQGNLTDRNGNTVPSTLSGDGVPTMPAREGTLYLQTGP